MTINKKLFAVVTRSKIVTQDLTAKENSGLSDGSQFEGQFHKELTVLEFLMR